MILAKTPWLQKRGTVYIYGNYSYLCGNILKELWELDPEEEIQLIVHDGHGPERHTMRLEKWGGRSILHVGFDWCLINFYWDFGCFLDRFYEKHPGHFVFIECVGRK